MKELSIEEKAKAYDEAIEKAKTLYKNANGMILKKWVEQVFPELKESEGERIRKALMQNLKERFGTKGNMGEGLDMPDVLAWLDKQGEQKPTAWSEEDEKIKENIITGLEMLKDGVSDQSLIALYNKRIDWIKSLKDRYTWKPSDEQISCLYDAVARYNREGFSAATLTSLLEQLKKLREE